MKKHYLVEYCQEVGKEETSYIVGEDIDSCSYYKGPSSDTLCMYIP